MCALVPGCVTTKVQVLLPLVVVLTYTCDWCWGIAQQASPIHLLNMIDFWLETIKKDLTLSPS